MNKKSFLIILVTLLVTYFPIIFDDVAVNPDAQIILPNLESFRNWKDYLIGLFSLKTIDFQPVRDLTFFVDLIFYHKLNLNTFVLQNILWWAYASYLTWKITTKVYSKKDPALLLLVVLGFSVYPLFSFVVTWGMARKHILSFVFILLAIHALIESKDLSKKQSLRLVFYYLLSVLSQPINILMPVWAAIYLRLYSSADWKRVLKFLIPTMIVFVLIGLINYAYYQFSPEYFLYYSSKTSQVFDVADQILALGHYFFQLIFPYLLAYSYQLGDNSQLVGMGLLIIFSLVLYKLNKKGIKLFLWPVLGGFSLVVVLVTPTHLFDTYLLLPAFSILMVILYFLPSELKLGNVLILGLLVLGWARYSHHQSKNWMNYEQLVKTSFERRPNCINVTNYLRIAYDYGTPPSIEAKDYLKHNGCLKRVVSNDYGEVTQLNLLSHMLFYENFFPMEKRIDRLRQFSKRNLMSHLTLVAFFLKNGRTNDADIEIKSIIKKMKDRKVDQNEFHLITFRLVHPYCLEKKWLECLEITAPFSVRSKTPY